MAYEKTEVTVSRSQEQIRNVLRKHQASRINFGEQLEANGDTRAGVEFVYRNTLVRMLARIAAPDPDAVWEKEQRSRTKTAIVIADEMTEQEARRMWRVLHWAIKVRMEAVEEGLETFEQAFLPHIVDPSSGSTLWEQLRPSIDAGYLQLGATGLPALTAGTP